MEHHPFPTYSAAEVFADSIVHVAGVSLGVAGAVWMIITALDRTAVQAQVSLGVYALGLLAMLGASAAYNMTPPGMLKGWLRRLDHAMIYVMIAGTYTPFALYAVRGRAGVFLCFAVWMAALAGIVLKIGFPRRFEWAGFALYLCMGWAAVAVIGRIYANLQVTSFALLIAGGVVYTLGSVVHHMPRLKFHNAIWHLMVLVAAAAHFMAIARLFTRVA